MCLGRKVVSKEIFSFLTKVKKRKKNIYIYIYIYKLMASNERNPKAINNSPVLLSFL